eukprot:3887772-Prorocentrum_lima.AAC.1
MGLNTQYTDPVDLNILDFNKLKDERETDIRKGQASLNGMLDELQIPGPRVPGDYEALGHTHGVVGDVA